MKAWAALSLFFAAPAPGAPVAQEIARLLESTPAARSAFWGIQVVDLANGRTLYSHNADRLFLPASNAKLLTTALALERLGPGFRFTTRLLAETAPDDTGTVSGALHLVGGGDPNLSGRAVPYQLGAGRSNPLGPIEELADQAVARGVKRVTGGIIGDDTRYVWEPVPEGWTVDDTRYDYGAPVSALTINDNIFTLVLRPSRAGELAEVSISPPVEYYNIDNRVQTAAAGGERRIRLDREAGSRQLRLWGSIPVRAPAEVFTLAIADPAEYAAQALQKALEERGVIVQGPIQARHRFPAEEGSGADTSGYELARRDSAPLIEDLKITNKVSQNLHAELALRAVALARRNTGSRQAGLEELKSFLAEVGIGSEAYSLSDGSGLDRADLVAPYALVRLLRHMYVSPERENWIGLLPVGGEDGTLSGRLGEGPSVGRIHAKTGTLNRISALSGYAERSGGNWLAFSIMVNNYNGPAAEARGLIDRICTLLLE
ncbi:MAG: D-alanyl-D-alanine carboxypeptidase/D-alanyl-D-alanine-endopeptidase [Terriglobia bacterium]|nr:MAG: D-alanyl-D-alanine carboxypeptidase/D-alanyl-D-alanine-endopeptidase [Terriglobia bacterium]